MHFIQWQIAESKKEKNYFKISSLAYRKILFILEMRVNDIKKRLKFNSLPIITF